MEVKKLEYTALYRKFRPLKFDEIVGQEHIVRTLKMSLLMIGLAMLIYLMEVEELERLLLPKF